MELDIYGVSGRIEGTKKIGGTSNSISRRVSKQHKLYCVNTGGNVLGFPVDSLKLQRSSDVMLATHKRSSPDLTPVRATREGDNYIDLFTP